jgi:acetyltransferase-like isoleucine patch superfamily enzyme
VLSLYRLYIRVKSKCFSLLISGSFAGFGRRTVFTPPIRIVGERQIKIGSGVFMGAGCWIQALSSKDNDSSILISIGDGTSVSGNCVISAVERVVIGENVLMARNVYISDHAHRYADTDLPILAQGVEKVRAVHIKSGAWLGQNVVVCPGSTIGRGAVIGANSLVNQDVPDFSVAVGSPIRILKRFSKAG